MGDYTIKLRDLYTPDRFGNQYYTRDEVESWFKDYELSDYLTTSQIETITNAGMWSKEKLAKKIVDYYDFREIGFETPAMFEHEAKVKMNAIMEYELPVVYSNSLEYDPLESVLFDITETRNIDGEGTSGSSSTSNGSGTSISNDTPQTNIAKADILSGRYASQTNGSESESSVTGSTNTQSHSYETWIHHEQGNKGVLDSYQRMLVDYRKSIVAVDTEIIKKLDDLFMGIY